MVAKHMLSRYIIAHFNIMGYLKPKGKCMYKWCCYASYQIGTNLSVMKFSKNMEAGMLQRVVEYFFAQKVRNLRVSHYFHKSTWRKNI